MKNDDIVNVLSRQYDDADQANNCEVQTIRNDESSQDEVKNAIDIQSQTNDN